MKTKILIGIFFVSTILLIMPSISSVQLLSIDQKMQSIDVLKIPFYKNLDGLAINEPPEWFSYFYNMIIYSLNIRINIVTPLAINPSGEHWGEFEVNNIFFFIILLTLVYRFAFWYNLFEKIAERNNWDLH